MENNHDMMETLGKDSFLTHCKQWYGLLISSERKALMMIHGQVPYTLQSVTIGWGHFTA